MLNYEQPFVGWNWHQPGQR